MKESINPSKFELDLLEFLESPEAKEHQDLVESIRYLIKDKMALRAKRVASYYWS